MSRAVYRSPWIGVFLGGVLAVACASDEDGGGASDGDGGSATGGAATGGAATGGTATGGSATGGSATGGTATGGTATGGTATGGTATGGSATGGTATGGTATGGTATGGASADLCGGLITDKSPHPMTALAKPAVGQTVTDPQFGTTLRRISDSGANGVIIPMYSTIPAWNADESLLILYEVGGGHRLYDGRTYEFLRVLDIDPPDLEQVYWHPTEPDILLYVRGNRMVRHHVSTGNEDVLHTFSFCSDGPTGGDDPMYISWDGSVIGLMCDGEAFTYDIGTDTVGTRVAASSGTAPQAGPSGALLYLDGDVVDFDMAPQRALDLGDPWEHASVGRLANGHDAYFGVQFDAGAECEPGTLVAHDMTDGTCRVIVGEGTGYPYPPSGTHVSALATQRPGWVVVGIVGDTSGAGLLDNELLLADTSPGGPVCRIAHHRSHGGDGPQGYWAEPHAVVSPSGTRVLFGSDWGGGESVDAYVVELPAYDPTLAD